MAPPIGPAGSSGGGDFPARLTGQVILCSLIAACGGLMFGYDIGISGGVTSMDSFLQKFFHGVYEKKQRATEDNYCKFDDQLLQLFTSSLYIAAMFFSVLASWSCKKLGRKPTMQLASLFFIIGVVLDAAAINLPMLIIGRVCLGAGVGFGNQAVPLFISEIAPAKYRGGLNVCFQLLITIGILLANLVNFLTSKFIHENAWRYSLGGAVVPALLLGIGSIFIVETPTSLIERGKKKEGIEALKRTRGVEDVQKEFKEIELATEMAKEIRHPYRTLFTKRSNWPQLICGTLLQVFQQFTGINVVMFYAPVLFQTMGVKGDVSLLSAVATGGINVLATFVAVFGVDYFGRRKLLLQGAIQMVISQIMTGAILYKYLKATNMIPVAWSVAVIIFICVFVMGFAWSWGPLGWLVASEIFPLETRAAGYSIAVITNMLCTAIIAQVFLSMLCTMKSGTYFFFSGCIVAMGIAVYFFLPETRGIPIDEMNERVWKKHWFWKKFFDDDTKGNGGIEVV